MSGQMLCGTTIALSGSSNLFAEIIAVNGIGASRVAVDGTTSADVTAGWCKMIYSCLAKLEPFRVTISFNTNFDWKAAIKAAAAVLTITWPTAEGYSSGGTVAFTAGLTNYLASGGLQERLTAELTITPSGEPTVTSGTATT